MGIVLAQRPTHQLKAFINRDASGRTNTGTVALADAATAQRLAAQINFLQLGGDTGLTQGQTGPNRIGAVAKLQRIASPKFKPALGTPG